MKWICSILQKSFCVLVCFSFAGNGSLAGEKDGVIIQDVSFFMTETSSICFGGDLQLSENSYWYHHGKAWFTNPLAGTVVLLGHQTGSGGFIFNGSADCQVYGQNIQVGSFTVDLNGGGLYVEGSVDVLDTLTLRSGILHVVDESQFIVSNPSVDAVVFDNTVSCQSHVDGMIFREVLPGKTYSYPVGCDRAYHPFLVSDADKNERIGVQYDPAIFSVNTTIPAESQIRSIESGGWKIHTGSLTGTKFSIVASLLDDTQTPLGVDNYGIVYSSPENYEFSEYSIDLDASRTNNFYLSSSLRVSDGYFGFAKLSALELINFILVNGTSNTVFEVPNLSSYDQIELKVYNHWGSVVYSNSHYKNDLDFRTYAPGTYYYYMTLWTGDSPVSIRNIVEVKAGQ